MKRILVVNVNWLGDVIFSTPVYRALKERFPDARISALAVPRVREVLESCPFVDEVIVYDEEGNHRGPLEKWQLIGALRKKRFDVAFLLHRSWTRALLVYLAGIPERVGFDTKARGCFLTCRVALPPADIHRSDSYLSVIEGYGIPVADRCCELKVDTNAVGEVNRMLSAQGITLEDRLVVVHVSGNWDLKRWPKENWATLIQLLITELRVKVVLPGGESDRALIEEVANLSGAKPQILVGKTSLMQLIALMKEADLVVSADSGPLHAASAIGAVAIAIFGPTRPEVTGPRGRGEVRVLQKDVGCNEKPCYHLACQDNVCMKAVTVDEVLSAAREILEKKVSCH